MLFEKNGRLKSRKRIENKTGGAYEKSTERDRDSDCDSDRSHRHRDQRNARFRNRSATCREPDGALEEALRVRGAPEGAPFYKIHHRRRKSKWIMKKSISNPEKPAPIAGKKNGGTTFDTKKLARKEKK